MDNVLLIIFNNQLPRNEFLLKLNELNLNKRQIECLKRIYDDNYIDSISYYNKFSGHDLTYLDIIHRKVRQKNMKIIWLCGDSSLDNKHWFPSIYTAAGIYKNILEKSKKFVFKDKSLPINYKDRENYYKEISDYKYGLSLNGAAKICYRDLEYFGMGILNFRESLDIFTYEPIVENKHYFKIIDDDIKRRLYDKNEESYILDKINYNFKSIIKNNDTNKVIENSLEWFEKNCLPKNQIKILYSFLENFKIFE
jgi:hypothetical protein